MKTKNTKVMKFITVLLSIVMAAGILPVSVSAASAEITYKDENGASRTVEAIVLDSSTTTLTTGWYVVEGAVSTTNLALIGEVNLILADGCTLTAGATGNKAAIEILNASTMTIYGQTSGTGTLTATGSGRGAGIGGSGGADSSTAGAGQASKAGGNCGTVTVAGGRVTANRIGGGDGGHGISTNEAITDGSRGGSSGTITVKGGSLTVSGKVRGGNGGESEYRHGGDGGDLINFTVSGGIVNIGSICGGNGGDGDYSYTSFGDGMIVPAGIAGDGGSGGTVAIRGGKLTVSGSICGGNAGRTSIDSCIPGNGGAITVSGGMVSVSGMIGGGSQSSFTVATATAGDGSCIITGGSLTAATLRPVPTNGSANGGNTVSVTTVKLDGVSSATAVKYLFASTAYTYGTKDLSTDTNGNLSLWLPGGASVTQAYTAVSAYSGSVAAGASGTLSEIPLESDKPTVVSAAPADGAENVPKNGNISVTFSEMLDASVGTISLSPAEGSSIVLSGGSWSSNNTVYTIPYSGLSLGAAYTIVISGFTDLAGNTMEEDTNYNFQVIPPAVIPIYDYSYVDETGDIKTVSATKIESAAKTLTTGWYAAEGSLNLTNVTISGDVRLILTDGCALAVNGTDINAAVRIKSGNSLTIYGQTLGTGTLSATSSGRGAGIGGNGGSTGMSSSSGDSCGTLKIYGGTVTATRIGGGGGSDFYWGSGYTGGSGGTITINGGTVVTNRIGGGDGGGGSYVNMGGNGGNGSSLTINGGNVTVTGKTGGGAAGSGRDSFTGMIATAGAAGSCTITGGSVKFATIQPTPKNGSANGSLTVSLTTVTLGSVSTVQAVKAILTNLSSTYGTRDMKTDTSGKLYLWFPSGASINAAYTQGNFYKGSISAGATGTLALTAADSQKPVISSTAPADKTTDVPVNGSISITFSKVMDIWKGGVTLSRGGSDIAALTGGAWTYSGTVYTVPYSGISYSQEYVVSLSGFQDASGYTADSSSLSFTTAAMPKSVAVGVQSGKLINAAAGSAAFPVSTVSIESGAAITLNNINSVQGIKLETLETEGDSTAVTISTSAETPAGTHPLTLTIDGVTSSSFSLAVDARVYGISLSQTGLYTFLGQEADYAPVNEYSVTITNTGNSPAGMMTIGLTGEDSSCFTLSKTEIPDIAAGGSNSFTIRPIDSLPIDIYTATVTVSGTNIVPQIFDVSFTVNERTGNNVNGVTEPAAAAISGTNITASVENIVTSQAINISVSPGASWRFYRDVACTDEIADKTMALSLGANIAFIQVTAEDGQTKLYAFAIARMNEQPDLSPSTKVIIGTSITFNGGTIQLTAEVITTKTNKSVVWSIVNGNEYAVISPAGLLTANSNGVVTVRAAAQDGSGVYQEIQVVITGQSLSGVNQGIGLKDESDGVLTQSPPPANSSAAAAQTEEDGSVPLTSSTVSPQTGEDSSAETSQKRENGRAIVYIMLGILVLCGAVGILAFRIKRKTKNLHR